MPVEDAGADRSHRIPSLPNTLEYIGISPIPFVTVQQYKIQRTAVFRRYAVWWFQSLNCDPGANDQIANVYAWLVDQVANAQPAPDNPRTPESVLRLTKTVLRRIKNVRFGVDYFRECRILWVSYSDYLARHRTEYLSIWDNNGVVAIAAMTKPRSFWRTLFNRGVSG